jgi:DNA replication and repair protein RecF
MSLEWIELVNFRSYEDRRFRLSPNINLVVGPNASGKTNLLESVFVLALTRSFRAHDKELVRHDQDFYRVVGQGKGQEFALAYSNQDGKQEKKVSHNQAKKPLAQHIGRIQVVLFEPGDLDMVAGAPEIRRRYLDYILCQTDRQYLLVLAQYKRILRQRNALLSDFNTSRIKDEIFAWDIKLTEVAAEIYRRRTELLERLQPLAEEFYYGIADERIDLRLEYLPSVPEEDYANGFMTALTSNLTRDLAVGYTTIGPHREDFKISFGHNKVTAVASRGEIRTAVLAMKLAELDYCQASSGQKPILLLDDVFSELDQRRRQDLLVRLQDHQTIITTTEADAIEPQIKGVYQVIETSPSRVS